MLVFYFRTPEVAHVSGHEPIGPHWPGRLAMLVLLLSTAAVAVISDVFVGTLDAVISDVGISAVFLGLIIVPLVGNIAENIVGIKIAYQNDMDFSMLVSLGSSLQIALGVAPALVFISLLTPHHFDLLFPVMQVVSLAAAVFITALIAVRRRVELAGGRAADGRLRDHRNGGVVPVTRTQQWHSSSSSASPRWRWGCRWRGWRASWCSSWPAWAWPAWPGRWARPPNRPAGRPARASRPCSTPASATCPSW